jgi:hypothetical protein
MATLDAFGFAKGSRRVKSQQQINSATCAFVNPANAVIKKPKLISSIISAKHEKKPSHNTIKHYFFQTQQPTEEEEEGIRCIIRQQIPVLQLWDRIQDEYIQDTYMQMDPDNLTVAPINHKKRRHAHTTIPTLKRQKTDLELSRAMAQFLCLSNKVKHFPLAQQDLFMKDYQEEEQEEHLSRPLRHKMGVQHSNLYIHQITQEFLLLD